MSCLPCGLRRRDTRGHFRDAGGRGLGLWGAVEVLVVVGLFLMGDRWGGARVHRYLRSKGWDVFR